METKANYTTVGIFVITLVAFVVLSIIWLSAGLGFQQYKIYKVYMTESVSGLSQDSAVEFNGVSVGTVKSVSIDDANPQRVVLLLNIQADTPVTQGTRAMLNGRGLTGVTFVALEDKGTDHTLLQKLPGEPYPVIPTRPSLLLRIDTALTKLSEDVAEVSTAITRLLDKENLESVRQILNNVNALSVSLIGNTKQFNVLMDNSIRATRQLAPLLQMLELQALPAVNQTLTNLSNASRNISEISATVKQNPSILLRGSQPLPPGPGER